MKLQQNTIHNCIHSSFLGRVISNHVHLNYERMKSKEPRISSHPIFCYLGTHVSKIEIHVFQEHYEEHWESWEVKCF